MTETLAPPVLTPGKPFRLIYDARNQPSSSGALVRSEGDPPTPDLTVNEIYDGLGKTYDFFWSLFLRDSLDNQGSPLVATVHFDKNYNNAFWNGKQFIV